MPISCLDLPAPAKINLFLHVCGRRPDGYHNLQTAFQFIDIADRIALEKRDDGIIHLDTVFADIATTDNLVFKAASALKNASNCPLGVTIRVTKNLPTGAGIGGGSSDAATTLVGLNLLWELGLSKAELASIGVKLGADIPIFIHGHSAWAEGIGEQLSDINIDENWYLLLIPPCHVSTATIFSHPELTRDSKMMKMAAFLEQGSSSDFRNDCESLVRRLYPEVDEALHCLSTYSNARMTGTGACVFARFATQEQALEAASKIPGKFRTVVSKGLNQSPLYAASASVKQVF